jgi:hypothetical protein
MSEKLFIPIYENKLIELNHHVNMEKQHKIKNQINLIIRPMD